MTPKEWALQLIEQFRTRDGTGVWPMVKRADVADGLRDRVNDPSSIDQNNTYLCGPSAFVRDWCIDDPVDYAWAGIQLFENGVAAIARDGKCGRVLRPSKELRMSVLPKFVVAGRDQPIQAADWVVVGSIRDSYNWIASYTADEGPLHYRGWNLPSNVANMFRAAGYTEVHDYTWMGLVVPGMRALGVQHAQRASEYFLANFKVVMMINANMLNAKTQGSRGVISHSDHFIGLTSEIVFTAEGNVVFHCFTYGKERRVPEDEDSPDYKPLSVDDFLKNYYGFIVARH